MPCLFDAEIRRALIDRLRSLQPEDQPRWGGLSVAAMLAHLHDANAITFGARDGGPPLSWFLRTRLGRWLVIDSPMSWPRGRIKAPPAFHVSAPGDFHSERDQVLAELERFAHGPEQAWGVSPGFGALDPGQWSRLTWRHTDHHLRQFGR